MAAQKLVVVTGHKELDAKLRGLPAKIQRKFVRGALRRGMKRVVQDYKRIVRTEAYETGTMMRATKTRALKRSRKRIGFTLHIDREKLFAAYRAKYGHDPHPMKGRTDPHYYPASIEFGTDSQPAVRPMRRALYDNEDVIRAYFVGDVKQFIAENKVTTALPKVVKGSKL